MTNQDFLKWAREQAAKDCKVPNEQYAWMASRLEAEDILDNVSTNDLAAMINNGSWPVYDTAEKADTYFTKKLEECMTEDKKINLEMLNSLMNRIQEHLK